MTNTEAGLLDDIIANPADDVPRLILADWLEERGSLRGTFIRKQIWLHNAAKQRKRTRIKQKRKRNAVMWQVDNLEAIADFTPELQLGGLYAADLPILWRGNLWVARRGTGGKTEGCVLYRRGFLAEIHGPLTVLLEHLPRLVREQPIERVRVTDREPQEDRPGQFNWYREGSYIARENATLSEEIWVWLPPDVEGDGPDRIRYHSQPTADAAHAALSVALLRWAKVKPAEEPAP